MGYNREGDEETSLMENNVDKNGDGGMEALIPGGQIQYIL